MNIGIALPRIHQANLYQPVYRESPNDWPKEPKNKHVEKQLELAKYLNKYGIYIEIYLEAKFI